MKGLECTVGESSKFCIREYCKAQSQRSGMKSVKGQRRLESFLGWGRRVGAGGGISCEKVGDDRQKFGIKPP